MGTEVGRARRERRRGARRSDRCNDSRQLGVERGLTSRDAHHRDLIVSDEGHYLGFD